MDAARKQELIERFVAAYNRFDVDGMVTLLAPEVRFENYCGGQLTAWATGVAEFRELAERSKTRFSERAQRIVRIQIAADTAIASVSYRGVLAVGVPGGASAGSVIELQGESEYGFSAAGISRIVDRS